MSRCRRKRRDYRVCAAYDTETSRIHDGAESQAYPILYIVNDLRECDLEEYEPDVSDDVRFMRAPEDMLAYLEELISWGSENGVIPIVAAYNATFDLQTILASLANTYEIAVNAQSSTNIYTLDLCDDDENVLLRFWDTFHLEMRGLAAMGKTCGLAKATGDWDYDLVRTPETPLTDLEYFYAARDVQVIPAYLRYLLEANEWLDSSDFGHILLTKTSIVRQMAKHTIGNKYIHLRNGKSIKMLKGFETLCAQEAARDFDSYALRKACFRGGFTFTSALTASTVQHNVASMDVTSMHHAFICGRMVPVRFNRWPRETLQRDIQRVLETPLEDVLAHYEKPFMVAFHVRVRFEGIRLKSGSAFEAYGIGLAPEAKFATKLATYDDGGNKRAVAQEEAIRALGWIDAYEGATFAFGKLYSADAVEMHLSEVELYAMSLVYDWDRVEAIAGESTMRFITPPDYVTLQSNVLFETKSHAKEINKHYHEGVPYDRDIPSTIPEGLADGLRKGELTNVFWEGYYNSTVKGMFNSIYGTMAQDVLKPEFVVDTKGEFHIDGATVCTPDNFADKQPEKNRVLYTYGLRIVGGSRLHLAIAIELLYQAFGMQVLVTGGDTDSIKVATNDTITDEMLINALAPLHFAITRAIDVTMARVRAVWPHWASTLDDIGLFEVEASVDGKTRWPYHLELWNKARISVDGSRAHVTCAGLSRPGDKYHIETLVHDLIEAGYPVEDVMLATIGYNVTIYPSICHSLQRTTPKATDRVHERVTDYKGNTYEVDLPEGVALYPIGRAIGETMLKANFENVNYLRDVYGRAVDERMRLVYLDKQHRPTIALDMGIEAEVIMQGDPVNIAEDGTYHG